jgi:transposase
MRHVPASRNGAARTERAATALAAMPLTEVEFGGGVHLRIGHGAAMIPISSGVRVWIATGHTDMRRGMQGLPLQVQDCLKRDPHGGDLFVFRGRKGDLIKILWHDGIGLSLYAERLDKGRLIWPSVVNGAVAITAAEMAYMLEVIDWRNPNTPRALPDTAI